MSNGALRDAVRRLHQGALCCQNVTQFLGTRVPVTVHMYVHNSSTALPAASFTIPQSANSNTRRSLVQNLTLIVQYQLIYALH
jgi:hypothetical protein